MDTRADDEQSHFASTRADDEQLRCTIRCDDEQSRCTIRCDDEQFSFRNQGVGADQCALSF